VQGAEILGDPARGELAAGLIADVVVTDCDLNPVEVYRAGQLVK
jgi:N-acetylglucosamine-6-phosphate deacetylase